MGALECPRCGLFSPSGAEVCDCGYRFKTAAGETQPQSDVRRTPAPTKSNGKTLEFRCEWCGHTLTVAADRDSRLTDCTHCGRWTHTPEPPVSVKVKRELRALGALAILLGFLLVAGVLPSAIGIVLGLIVGVVAKLAGWAEGW